MSKVRIAVVDTGISSECKSQAVVTEEFSLVIENDSYCIKEGNGVDDIGHGSAVSDIIYKYNSEIELINIKIAVQDRDISCEHLCMVLKFILDNLTVDIINVSAGVRYIEEYNELKHICDLLNEKGVYIVSAFDNNGAMSYPAAFESVIGVDTIEESADKNDIIFMEGGNIDLLIPVRYYRTSWLHGERTLLKGTSFSCGMVTAIIAKKITEYDGVHPEKNEILGSISTKILHVKKSKQDEVFPIKRAIIFPVNKETHAVLKYRDLLKFELLDVYDEKKMGRVGQEMFDMKIKSYKDIDWASDFDTIILSCTSSLSNLTHVNYKREVTELAEKYGKNIYTLEDIKTDYEKVFYPRCTKEHVPYENLSKLWKLLIPVVGVFGTSSKQGKYSLQLELKRELSKRGYQVGQLATEPSGYLFGAEYVFHCGYESKVDLLPEDVVSLLNKQLWKIQKAGKDIVITGSQSMTLHHDNGNLKYMPLDQQNFLFGTLPDFMILCVNPHDDIEYIKRCIQYLNAIDVGKVYAIAIFPIKTEITLSGMQYQQKTLQSEELEEYKKYLYEQLALPAFTIGQQDDIEQLCNLIIDTLSED